MTSASIPSRVPAAPTRRCPGGCHTRVRLDAFACEPCVARLPFAQRQQLQASRGRDLVAYRTALHHARVWFGTHPPDSTP